MSKSMKLRLETEGYNKESDAFIDEGAEDGTIMVHGGNDLDWNVREEVASTRKEKCEPVTRVIFLLDTTKIGNHAFFCAVNLIVVESPEGVQLIGHGAFKQCSSLTVIFSPAPLRLIAHGVFQDCSSLKNVELLHTNLQQIGMMAFFKCSELTSMTVPGLIQYVGEYVFDCCDKLVPSGFNYDDAVEVITHLRSLQPSSTTMFAELRNIEFSRLEQDTRIDNFKLWSRIIHARRTGKGLLHITF
ncbi:hypothetical protein TrLO_g15082 [Triparma laevis f. longispina]|uniref:Uncharacterized protein n=1 Tax=Triparma laevis f. longispina TaxID=1714387 RepID=A0A9W7E4X6_9STRA|nr:hypothetical protein TrLO_g15082 [Triparma laevis f. longispina]